MILCLDVGNSHIFGGVVEGANIHFRFRKDSTHRCSSDEFGVFFRQVIRENGFDPGQITAVSLCSVVPDLVHSIVGACEKYFSLTPFILQAGVRTGLKVNIKNPAELGADRIGNAIGAISIFPEKPLLIVDFGTATTVCAITGQKEYLGGVICPGMRISMEALESKTARLPKVEIRRPESCLGRTTAENIQSGLYYGSIGMLKEIIGRLQEECFEGRSAVRIATGGFSRMFSDTGLFDELLPDLILVGLVKAYEINRG